MENKYHFKENGYIVDFLQKIDTFYYTQILGKEEGIILHSKEVDFNQEIPKIIEDIFKEPKVSLPKYFRREKIEGLLEKILDKVK